MEENKTRKGAYYRSLLSLLPPSCMVAPVREVANKHCSLSSAFSTNQTMTSYPSDVEMGGVDDGKLRGHSAISSKCSSRESSILSNASSIPYHRRMEINNNLSEEDYTNARAKVNKSRVMTLHPQYICLTTCVTHKFCMTITRLSIQSLGTVSSILFHSMVQWSTWQRMPLTSRSLSDVLGNTFSIKKLNKVRLIALLI